MTPRLSVLLSVPFAVFPILRVGADDLPWVFNAPRADGYSISLVSADPAPGTPLVAGDVLHFKATVTYTMSIAKHGVIVLVFQDEKTASAVTTQVQYEVNGSAGVASLAAQLTVPRRAKELRVIIPIVPDGLMKTSGEVTIRYPITRAVK